MGNYIRGIILEVLESLGFVIEPKITKYNSFIDIWIPRSDYYYEISYNWYYPDTIFRLIIDSEKVKELDKNYEI